MDEVLAYLKENPTYFLATVDENGDPDIRPFGTIAKFEDRLYIQTGNSKAVFEQMKAHPRIAISATNAGGTTWLRVVADAVQDDRLEARQAVLDEYPELQSLYAADDGNCEVLFPENAQAAFCSFTEKPRTVTF